jgi:hypothetical protein
MKEVSLQEAIELCREKGGRIYKNRSAGEYYVYLVERDYFTVRNDKYGTSNEHTNDPKVFSHKEITATWIYEPPKQSAFQKWRASYKPAEIRDVTRAMEHHEKAIWNAAIDEVLKIQTLKPSLSLLTVDEYHEAIKALKAE